MMSQSIVKMVDLCVIVLVIFLLVLFVIYGTDNKTVKKNFQIEITLVFIALVVSTFAAFFFHEQSLPYTLFAQREFYIFSFYLLLHKMMPDRERILKMFILLAYIYAAVYVLQFVLYPRQIVADVPHLDRGSVRVGIPGADYMILSWFILLGRFFKTKRIRYILAILPFFIVLIIMASRQVLASVALGTIVYIVFSKDVKSKFWIFILVILAIVSLSYLFKGIITQIIEAFNKDPNDIRQNIRFVAARYFLFDFNNNPLWILTGNGMPEGHSDYGKIFNRLAVELGYFQSDVGIIGDFSKFGILFVLAEFSFLLKLLFYKIDMKYSFVKYFALIWLLTMFTGSGLGISSIVTFCFLFYFVDIECHYKKSSIQ